MSNSRSIRTMIPVAVAALISVIACGGGSTTAPSAPSTTATTLAAATPTPTPTATPTPVTVNTPAPVTCGLENMAPGPVASYRIRVKDIRRGGQNGETIEEANWEYDGQGRVIVHVGDFVAFDSTQKNAAGEKCQWRNDPVWSNSNPGAFAFRERSRQGTNCGFGPVGDAIARGTVSLDATLDGNDAETVVDRLPTLEIVVR